MRDHLRDGRGGGQSDHQLGQLVTLFAVPPSRIILLGWMRGEACYRGLPTSWWRAEITAWDATASNKREHTFLEKWRYGDRIELVLEDYPFHQVDASAIQVLLELLKHKDTRIREAAASGLGWIGPEANSAFAALLDVADDEVRITRTAVWVALLCIDEAAANRAGFYWVPSDPDAKKRWPTRNGLTPSGEPFGEWPQIP